MTLSRRQLLKTMAVLPAVTLPLTGPSLASAGLTPITLHSARGPHKLNAEMATTPAQRRTGLMAREYLPADQGMLFTYSRPQPPSSGFWMYRTRIPLDIAFIDGEGKILALHTMSPCRSENPADCPAYPAGVAFQAALEVNAGYFKDKGIELGDCISVPGLDVSCR